MKKKLIAFLNKFFDGKPPANLDLDKLAGELETEVGTVPTENSIKEMIKNALAEERDAAGKEEEDDATEETEEATDSADEDADDATEDADADDEDEKPSATKTANKAKAKPAENAVSKKDFEAVQNELKSLKKQMANRAGGKSRPAGNNTNADEPADPTDHEGIGWV